MHVGNSGTEYIIPTPLLKDIVGIERLKVSLPEGELETCVTAVNLSVLATYQDSV